MFWNPILFSIYFLFHSSVPFHFVKIHLFTFFLGFQEVKM
jgi:hypothetical protein